MTAASLAIIRVVGRGIFTIWAVFTIVFGLLRLLPGDAIEAQYVGSAATPEIIEARRQAFYLDRSPLAQYALTVRDYLRGDFGQSLYGGQEVGQVLRARFATTLALAIPAFGLATGLGLLTGLGSLHTAAWIRFPCIVIIDLMVAVPIYWSATLSVLVLVPLLGISQSSLWLAVGVLAFHSSGGIARVVSTEMQEISQMSHVRVAYSKGLRQRAVISRHILPMLLSRSLGVITTTAGRIFGGTVITESIFLRGGLGVALLNATLQQNFTVVQGIVVLLAAITVVINSIADLCMLWLDPRIRHQ